MLLLLPLLWSAARGDDVSGRGKDTYLDAFMESHASLTGWKSSLPPVRFLSL